MGFDKVGQRSDKTTMDTMQDPAEALNAFLDAVYGAPEEGEGFDDVSRPSHYVRGGMEAKEVMRAMMTPEELRGYWTGCAFKYLWRWKDKGGLKDLKKCRECLDELIKCVEGEEDD